MNRRPSFPPYTPPLQRILGRADRLCELIALHELAPPHDEWAAAWLHGRAEELAIFAQDLLDACRAGRVEEEKAGAALQDYLLSLEEGLARHVSGQDRDWRRAIGGRFEVVAGLERVTPRGGRPGSTCAPDSARDGDL